MLGASRRRAQSRGGFFPSSGPLGGSLQAGLESLLQLSQRLCQTWRASAILVGFPAAARTFSVALRQTLTLSPAAFLQADGFHMTAAGSVERTLQWQMSSIVARSGPRFSWCFQKRFVRLRCGAAQQLSGAATRGFLTLVACFLSFVSLDLSSRCVIARLFGTIAGIVAEHVAYDSACVAIHQSCRCGEHERRFSNQFREKTNQQVFITFNRLVQTTRSTGTGFCFSL